MDDFSTNNEWNYVSEKELPKETCLVETVNGHYVVAYYIGGEHRNALGKIIKDAFRWKY